MVYGGLLALVSTLSLAAVPAGLPQRNDIDVAVRRDGKAIVVDVNLLVDASPRQAWEVLTDYNHMARFVSSLTMSRILARSDGTLEVAQIGRFGLGPFGLEFENLREVELLPLREIRSRLIRGDMKASTFTTRLVPEGDGTRIFNHGRIIPDRWIPPVIGLAVLRTAARKQFSELRAEIVRRLRHAACNGDAGASANRSPRSAGSPTSDWAYRRLMRDARGAKLCR